MSELDNIIDALASQRLSGLSIDEELKPRPKPTAAPSRPYQAPKPMVDTSGRSYSSSTPPRVGPMDRMGFVNPRRNDPLPKRQAFQMFSLSDDELTYLFNLPIKRNTDFSAWLETIGFPPDLHPKHDGATFSYAENAFLKLKQEAHRR